MNELKPCPFCGCVCIAEKRKDGRYKIVGDHDEDCAFDKLIWWEAYETKAEAIKVWNRRIEK